jgi:hypothetical protein
LLLRIQHAFRRQQLEYLDAAIQLPAMRRRALAEFALRFRQRDVKALFPGFRTFEQKLQRHRRFAGAGSAFHEKEMAARKPS